MAHSRMISEQFVFDLKEGILQEISKIVREDPELFLGLRGDRIDVYYNCNRLIEVTEKQKTHSYEVSFNIRHAKFTETKEEAIAEVQSLGMSLKDSTDVQCEISTYATDFWRAVIDLRKRWLADFFGGKTYNFFDRKKESNNRNEKIDQQKLARYNTPKPNGFCVYDVEYAEPNFKRRRFDLLALQTDEAWNAVALWILEVKSTGESLDEDSGVEDHYGDMDRYTGNPEYVRQRWADVKEIIAVYQALGLPGWQNIPTFADKHDESAMKYGFVMTAKADAHAQEYRNQFDCPFFIPNRKDKDNFVLDINEQEQKSEPTP
jgi:hypothetical protein